MNTLFRLKDFVRYRHKAGTAFRVHSPFAYAFYTEVVRSKQKFPEALVAAEQIRKTCLHSPEKIFVNDLGTGGLSKPSERKIKDIMRRYAGSQKDAFLLYRMVNYLKPATILELGTSLGISSIYMALANQNIPLTTIEGCPKTAAAARKNFEKLSLNINLICGNLDEVLPAALKKMQVAGLVYFDGNHTKEATLRYFDECLNYTDSQSVFVFDDIHWSPGMYEAWTTLCAHPKVTISMDLYRLGIVFFNKKISKQHYVLKY